MIRRITCDPCGEVKQLLAAGLSGAEIARRLTIPYHTVQGIKQGKAWKE